MGARDDIADGGSGALQGARRAYERRAWQQAYEGFARADRAGELGTEDLGTFACCAELTGRTELFLQLLAREYDARSAAAQCAQAAQSAFWIGMRLVTLGELARASGWLARAERSLGRTPSECAAHGYLLLPVAHRCLASGDHERARASAAQAIAIGERCGDHGLVAFAQTVLGRVLIRLGQTQSGLRLFDEAMLPVSAGQLSPILTGLLYCSVIAGCQQVYDLGRAREWTSALSEWCEAQPELVIFNGSCLVHRAELLQLGGAWSDALSEARRAEQAGSPPGNREAVAEGYYQEAEIHRLRGACEDAEQSYRRAHEHGRDPLPGLALLRLAQGRGDIAAGALQRALSATPDALSRVRLLPAWLDVSLALGDLERARAACEELEQTAAHFHSEILEALAGRARGALHLARGDAQSALAPLRRALSIWQTVGAPYLAARVRVQLGLACRALGDPEGAQLELDAARAAFEQLGAAAELAQLGEPPAKPLPSDCPLTVRELEVLRLVTTGKTNREIGRQLSLSEKTIDRHVSNIFGKLDVRSRAAATAYAYEHGLI